MNIYEKLLKIQTELIAPKGQYNDFGNYNYRSCEDILEALKPLLNEHKLILAIRDEIELIGDRYYVKATAELINTEEKESIETTAYAREDEKKKGMDSSQLTGSTSSYARKYALNGLFAIDDTKDSDYTNKYEDKPKNNIKKDNNSKCSRCDENISEKVKSFSTKKYGKALCFDCQKKSDEDKDEDKEAIKQGSVISKEQAIAIADLMREKNYTGQSIAKYIKTAYSKASYKDLTVKEADEVIEMLKGL